MGFELFHLTLGVQVICIWLLQQHGSVYLRMMLSKEILKGARVLTVAFSEPGSGLGQTEVALKAELSKSKQFYVLNGKKVFVPIIEQADFLIVIGRTEAGPSLFIVDRNTYGIYWENQVAGGQQVKHYYEVDFENVKIPAQNLIGKEGEGCDCLLSVLTRYNTILLPSITHRL